MESALSTTSIIPTAHNGQDKYQVRGKQVLPVCHHSVFSLAPPGKVILNPLYRKAPAMFRGGSIVVASPLECFFITAQHIRAFLFATATQALLKPRFFISCVIHRLIKSVFFSA